MKTSSSRRNFMAAGFGIPLAGLGAAASGAPDIRYRTLGRTGLKVSTVGFGCMITSDPSVIERAADIGINYFDTARGYQGGNNERMVGAALKRKRKEIFISTKSGADSKAGALAHLDTSLRELGTDYIDIWYLHGKDSPAEITDELIEAQQIARTAGKIRFAGFSTHSAPQVVPGAIRKNHFDVVLVTYNFTMDEKMESTIAQAKKAGVGVVAMKVMAGGYRKVKPGDKLYDKFKQEGVMLAALKWVLRNKIVDTTIPSMTDMDQLDENLRAMTEPFATPDEKLLAVQLEHIRPLYCRMCGECDGACPKGLPVANVLRYLTYADGYGQFALGRERFLALPEEVAGVRCNLCPVCSVQCPHGVNVAARLSRAQELFA